MSVVGLAILATFGSRSLTVFVQLFSDPSAPSVGGNSRFALAAFGVFVFATSEAILLFAGGWSIGRIVASTVGRFTQIIGFSIASFALLSGMFEFQSMASPNGTAIPDEIALVFNSNATTLSIGLCVVVLGQLVVTIGRYRDQIQPTHKPKSAKSKTKSPKKLSTIGVGLVLLIVVALFAFTTIFEFELIQKLKQSNRIELPILANDLQGMMIYPFLAYLSAISYCIVDGIRFVLAKSNPNQNSAG
jgi:hypothetical protein